MNIKWKNYGLWIALGSLITMILVDTFQLAPDRIQMYVDGALAILIAAGVVTNPSLGKGFKDKLDK